MDGLRRLVENARNLVLKGYYDVPVSTERSPSFLGTLGAPSQPADVIAEIKYRSPSSSGPEVSPPFPDLLPRLVRAGPLGLSVLAEPNHFGGSLDFVRAASVFGLPVLMKDIVVDPAQLTAAYATGASGVLVIQTLFTRGLLEGSSQDLVDKAHELDLDVVLEVHTPEEWDAAVATDADILGINNRDLDTMVVDLGTTPAVLAARRKDRPVIAMSGIERRDQVEAMLRAGADAVLVGSSLMAHSDPAKKLEELLHG